jgi:hypothetical protein
MMVTEERPVQVVAQMVGCRRNPRFSLDGRSLAEDWLPA